MEAPKCNASQLRTLHGSLEHPIGPLKRVQRGCTIYTHTHTRYKYISHDAHEMPFTEKCFLSTHLMTLLTSLEVCSIFQKSVHVIAFFIVAPKPIDEGFRGHLWHFSFQK